MKRSVLLAVLLVALILGAGAVLYERLFESGPTTATVDPDPVTTPAPPDLAPEPAATIDGGSLRGGALATRAPDAGPARAEPGQPQQAEVVSTRGHVQARSADGKWAPVAVGQRLNADESVRTGRNGEANLRFGEGIEVRLSPRSEFSVREIGEGLSRIRLEEGHVAASVSEDGQRVLRVEAKGSDAVAESGGGTFGVVTDGRGQLTVATSTGRVKLSAKGKSVDVEAGTASTVTKDSDGPSAPRPVPKSLFLKVADVPQRRTNRKATTVEGSTDPGSLVRVGDKIAKVDARGRFKVRVPLEDGKNRIAVSVLDAAGREKSYALPEIVVDRERPTIETDMQWGGGGTQ